MGNYSKELVSREVNLIVEELLTTFKYLDRDGLQNIDLNYQPELVSLLADRLDISETELLSLFPNVSTANVLQIIEDKLTHDSVMSSSIDVPKIIYTYAQHAAYSSK